MNNSRQQYGRNQRGNYRSNYSQNVSCGQCNMSKVVDCGCNQYNCMDASDVDCPERGKDPLRGMPIAMAYVPWQRFVDIFDECEALYRGTIFAELDLDFCGKRCE